MPDTSYPDYHIVDTANLIPYARNSRTHSESQVSQIAASIREFGFLNPVIVDDDNGIIAGHGRVLAAQKLGIDKLPAIQASHLTDAQKKAYVIADNKLALNAGWDMELLRIEISELRDLEFDTDLLGFEMKELDEIFDADQFSPGSEDDQGSLDDLVPKIVTCPCCGEKFDLNEQS